MHILYKGNSAYCYANSTSMLLSSIDENINPALIEVLSGVGLGAFQLKDGHICFFSNFSGLPDQGISRTLRILGFEFQEYSNKNYNNPPINKLGKNLPAVIGPLDMGYLTYDPNCNLHFGVDHFVMVLKIDKQAVYLHDPAGFPNVNISIEDLVKAWKAESIGYRRGYYRFWSKPKRVSTPSEKQIFSAAIKDFKKIYLTGEKYGKKRKIKVDTDAIGYMIENLLEDNISDSEWKLLTNFVFQLGARRCLDYSIYFAPHDPQLSELKQKQSEILGTCHVLAVSKKGKEIATELKKYSKLESEFKNILLSR